MKFSDSYVPEWVPVKNLDAEEVPPFGVVMIDHYDAEEGILYVTQPDGDSLTTNILVVSDAGLEASEEGLATCQSPLRALYETEEEEPTAEDTYGTQADSYLLKKGNTGFGLWAIIDVAEGLAVWGLAHGGSGGAPAEQDQTPTYVLYADLPDLLDATNVPTPFQVLRPFGGSVVGTGNGRLVSVFGYSRLPAGVPSYTHYLVCAATVDVRDGITRLAGSNSLTYVDGDEIRFTSASGARYVVVWVETANFGTANAFKRVYLMRHLPQTTGGP